MGCRWGNAGRPRTRAVAGASSFGGNYGVDRMHLRCCGIECRGSPTRAQVVRIVHSAVTRHSGVTAAETNTPAAVKAVDRLRGVRDCPRSGAVADCVRSRLLACGRDANMDLRGPATAGVWPCGPCLGFAVSTLLPPLQFQRLGFEESGHDELRLDAESRPLHLWHLWA
eukprot:365338-Chlamydomonas_euryale.AAC.34